METLKTPVLRGGADLADIERAARRAAEAEQVVRAIGQHIAGDRAASELEDVGTAGENDRIASRYKNRVAIFVKRRAPGNALNLARVCDDEIGTPNSVAGCASISGSYKAVIRNRNGVAAIAGNKDAATATAGKAISVVSPATCPSVATRDMSCRSDSDGTGPVEQNAVAASAAAASEFVTATASPTIAAGDGVGNYMCAPSKGTAVRATLSAASAARAAEIAAAGFSIRTAATPARDDDGVEVIVKR